MQPSLTTGYAPYGPTSSAYGTQTTSGYQPQRQQYQSIMNQPTTAGAYPSYYQPMRPITPFNNAPLGQYVPTTAAFTPTSYFQPRPLIMGASTTTIMPPPMRSTTTAFQPPPHNATTGLTRQQPLTSAAAPHAPIVSRSMVAPFAAVPQPPQPRPHAPLPLESTIEDDYMELESQGGSEWNVNVIERPRESVGVTNVKPPTTSHTTTPTAVATTASVPPPSSKNVSSNTSTFKSTSASASTGRGHTNVDGDDEDAEDDEMKGDEPNQTTTSASTAQATNESPPAGSNFTPFSIFHPSVMNELVEFGSTPEDIEPELRGYLFHAVRMDLSEFWGCWCQKITTHSRGAARKHIRCVHGHLRPDEKDAQKNSDDEEAEQRQLEKVRERNRKQKEKENKEAKKKASVLPGSKHVTALPSSPVDRRRAYSL